MNTPSEHRSQKKCVTFARSSRFRTVKPHGEYSPEEYTSTWYAKEEMDDILVEVFATVKRVDEKEPIDEHDGFCCRGLESKTSFGSRFRKSNKARAIGKVLEEQEFQKEMGFKDPLVLAEVYSRVTENSRELARLMARRDEKDARIFQPSSPFPDKKPAVHPMSPTDFPSLKIHADFVMSTTAPNGQVKENTAPNERSCHRRTLLYSSSAQMRF